MGRAAETYRGARRNRMFGRKPVGNTNCETRVYVKERPEWRWPPVFARSVRKAMMGGLLP